MKIDYDNYDPKIDDLRISISNLTIEESDKEKSGMILDYDEDGNIIGLKTMNASKRIANSY